MQGICAYNINQVVPNNELFLQLIQAHKNTVNTKKNEFVDNEEICANLITAEINRIFGKDATETIFRFLEKHFKKSRDKILSNIVEFNEGLELILGSGAVPIKKQFLKKLHKKLDLTNLRV